MPGPFLPQLRSGIEARVKWLEDQFNEFLRRLGNVEAKANRLDAQSQRMGPVMPQGGGGSGSVGSYWATTDGVVPGKSGGGPGVGTGTVVKVDDSLDFEGVGSGLTLINGWPDATLSDSWVLVLPTGIKDSDGNDVFSIVAEGCTGGGG